MPRYYGASECDAYKDLEYKWLTEKVMVEKEYESFTYNIVAVHIPLIYSEGVLGGKNYCDECGGTHGYKLPEFREAVNEMNVNFVLSAHTHVVRDLEYEGFNFRNIQLGGKLPGVVRSASGHTGIGVFAFKDGGFEYQIFK
jgi:hypothetical protein